MLSKRVASYRREWGKGTLSGVKTYHKIRARERMKLSANLQYYVWVGIPLGKMLNLEKKMNRCQIMKGLVQPGENLRFCLDKSKQLPNDLK